MSSTFLQEIDATVLWFDIRGFSTLAAKLGPLELGSALERFYEHVEAGVLKHNGKIVKFIGDAVLAAVLGSGDVDHAAAAMHLLSDSIKTRDAWLEENRKLNVPHLDYRVGVASGAVLAGYLGTPRLRYWDVLGQPVNTSARLAGLAIARDLSHLVTGETIDSCKLRPAAVEVEAVDLGGKRVRLFTLEQV
jgi:adenylate cyclase